MGVISLFGLIFLATGMGCTLCIESGLNDELFLQLIKLTDVSRFYTSSLAIIFNCFSAIN